MPNKSFSIHDTPVGPNSPPYIIAEAGVHHFNCVELAKQYILQASIAGANAIKFQTYSADRIATKWAPTYWDAKGEVTQHDIFQTRSRLSRDDYEELFIYANALNITFLSTPFDPDAAAMLDELGMEAYKIASADITNTQLLKTVSSFGKPVVLSTGAATFDEVQQAIELVNGYEVPLALLHCSLSYPTPLAKANLARIPALKSRFPNTILGYSDHTQPQDSTLPCPMSVTLGASIIEKHFTLNKSLPEDDHYHAVDQAGLVQLVKDCREAYIMSCSYEEITEEEQSARKFARRSIVAAQNLEAGQVLTVDDLDCKRPGTGVSPEHFDTFVGKRLVRKLKADELLNFSDVE